MYAIIEQVPVAYYTTILSNSNATDLLLLLVLSNFSTRPKQRFTALEKKSFWLKVKT